jgi:pimeloyl-ACP methyl ester carboxylesterase
MITLDGQRIDTAWWGERPDADLTLVLLHEGLGCIALWRDFPERLAQATGCPVFAYSRLGYGQSDPVPLPRPLDYMRAESRTILGSVLDQAGIGPCILIGHSDGASIAAIHAGSAGDARVRGVVLIAPHFFVEDIAITAIAAARDAYNQGTLRDRLARYHDHVDVAFRGWNDAWLDPGFSTFNLLDDVAGIRVPVLQLQGTSDPYGTERQVLTAAAHATCPVETALLDAKHAPHLEAPTESLTLIASFVQHLTK